MKWLLAAMFLSFDALSQVPYVAPARLLRDSGNEISGDLRMWNSTSRIDENGESQSYVDGEGFSYIDSSISGHYGATKELQLGFRANFRQNQALVEEPAASGNIETITSTGLQGINFELKYMLEPVGRLNYALKAFYQYHPFSNSTQNPTDRTAGFVLGDDGGGYGGGFILSYIHPSQNFLSLSAGYRRPGSEISPEIYWRFEGAMAWKWIALIAGIDGVTSLNQDPYTDDVTSKPDLNTGGSFIYNSINRQYSAPYVGANIALGTQWRVESRFQTFMAQRSFDSGTLVSLSLVRRIESDVRKVADNTFKEYELEASVSKVSPKKQFVILDKGLSHNVQKGQRFDLFHYDYVGGNLLLARGVIIQVNSSQSVLKLTTRFSNKHEIKEGTVARGMPR